MAKRKAIVQVVRTVVEECSVVIVFDNEKRPDSSWPAVIEELREAAISQAHDMDCWDPCTCETEATVTDNLPADGPTPVDIHLPDTEPAADHKLAE